MLVCDRDTVLASGLLEYPGSDGADRPLKYGRSTRGSSSAPSSTRAMSSRRTIGTVDLYVTIEPLELLDRVELGVGPDGVLEVLS